MGTHGDLVLQVTLIQYTPCRTRSTTIRSSKGTLNIGLVE